MGENTPPSETNAPQKFQRRTVLVKRSLQLKYVGMVFFSVLASSIIVGGDIYYSIARTVLIENPSLSPLIAQFNSIILVKVALYLGIMLLISLYISHRFAGPIYRFEKSAQDVSLGDLTHRVSLRTGDELMDLQEEFNGMVASLQSMVQKDRALSERCSERAGALLEKVSRGGSSPEILKGELEALKGELDRLTRSFKV